MRKCVRSPPLDEKKLYRNLAPRAPHQKMPPKKRKAETTELDEMDRELFTKFRAAASCVSGLYTSSLNLQKRAFNGGARHTTGKLLQWAENKLASGEPNISARDLINALQAELVVLQGEDSALSSAAAAVGDASNAGGGAAHWSGNTNDRAVGAGGGEGRQAGVTSPRSIRYVRGLSPQTMGSTFAATRVSCVRQKRITKSHVYSVWRNAKTNDHIQPDNPNTLNINPKPEHPPTPRNTNKRSAPSWGRLSRRRPGRPRGPPGKVPVPRTTTPRRRRPETGWMTIEPGGGVVGGAIDVPCSNTNSTTRQRARGGCHRFTFVLDLELLLSHAQKSAAHKNPVFDRQMPRGSSPTSRGA